MNTKHIIILFSIFILIAACAQTEKKIEPEGRAAIHVFMHVQGTIESVDGNVATVRASLPEVVSSTLSFTNRITQKIINKSFLLEKGATRINGQDVTVEEIRGNLLIVKFEDPITLRVGDQVKIFVPKKVLAITDFEVIRGHDKTVGVVSMESLTSAIVNSGQFNVVERNKLQTVIDELKIGLSGLADENKAKELGQILQADLVLTGTLADLGGYWNVNLRLINVTTGLIMAAIEEKALFADIKPEVVRDTTNINENFDGKRKPGWIIGSRDKFGAYRSVQVDRETGANDSSSSIRMSFRLKKEGAKAWMVNNRNRDLSQYSGIEFYAKSDQNLTAVFKLNEENRDSKDKSDAWFSIFEVDTTWNKHTIYFQDLSLSESYARRNPGGDGILSLHLVKRFAFGVNTNTNDVGTSGKLWIDEVRFF
jgi:TolB-like protein